MKTGKLIVSLACLVAVGASLGACREDEQGRVLLFTKGVYLGKADTPITEEARRKIRARAPAGGRARIRAKRWRRRIGFGDTAGRAPTGVDAPRCPA